jgi:hypothetical protein
MASIHPSDRNFVDESAASLIDVADNIRQRNSVLGDVYDELGTGFMAATRLSPECII